MSETRDDLREALACGDCGKALPTGVELYELTCDECLAAERDRVMAEARNHREPPPPPIPVRKRYYLTECRDCGWIGSSEQCDGDDESVVCPVCYSWHCEETPSEADTAKHGEAVMQRILAAEAGQKDALAQVSALQAEVERLQKVEGEREKWRVPDGTGLSPDGQTASRSDPSDFDPSRGEPLDARPWREALTGTVCAMDSSMGRSAFKAGFTRRRRPKGSPKDAFRAGALADRLLSGALSSDRVTVESARLIAWEEGAVEVVLTDGRRVALVLGEPVRPAHG